MCYAKLTPGNGPVGNTGTAAVQRAVASTLGAGGALTPALTPVSQGRPAQVETPDAGSVVSRPVPESTAGLGRASGSYISKSRSSTQQDSSSRRLQDLVSSSIKGSAYGVSERNLITALNVPVPGSVGAESGTNYDSITGPLLSPQDTPEGTAAVARLFETAGLEPPSFNEAGEGGPAGGQTAHIQDIEQIYSDAIKASNNPLSRVVDPVTGRDIKLGVNRTVGGRQTDSSGNFSPGVGKFAGETSHTTTDEAPGLRLTALLNEAGAGPESEYNRSFSSLDAGFGKSGGLLGARIRTQNSPGSIGGDAASQIKDFERKRSKPDAVKKLSGGYFTDVQDHYRAQVESEGFKAGTPEHERELKFAVDEHLGRVAFGAYQSGKMSSLEYVKFLEKRGKGSVIRTEEDRLIDHNLPTSKKGQKKRQKQRDRERNENNGRSQAPTRVT